VTARTNEIEPAACIEAISAAAAPWADCHAFSYRLVTFNTVENGGEDFFVALYEGFASHLTPVGSFLIL